MACFAVVRSSINLTVSKNILHRGLGHPSLKILNDVRKCKLPVNVNEEFNFYEACKFGKSHALPYQPSLFHATAPFELIYSDLWGLAPLMSTSGYHYYVHFVDDFSRFT